MPKKTANTAPKGSVKEQPQKKRKKSSILSCPVNGAGWCPYPFSIEQLEKRLKEKALAAAGSK
jgi:hypothetical protein